MAADARGEVEEFLLGDRFICLAGRSAWRQGGIAHRHYDLLGSEEAARSMALDLAEFVAGADWSARTFTSFVATFEQPRGVDELRFEELLWQQLQLLHDQDAETYGWAEGYSSDPQSGEFAYSVAGHPFFVIGLHETHRRWGRRPPFPMLAFNSHEQFDRIKGAGMWDRLAEKIRKQDVKLQGDINPNLYEYEQLPETRRYSGRPKPAAWQCPFSARGTEPAAERAAAPEHERAPEHTTAPAHEHGHEHAHVPAYAPEPAREHAPVPETEPVREDVPAHESEPETAGDLTVSAV